MDTVRLDTPAPGTAFRMPALGFTGVVEHVSSAMVRVAIQRSLNAPVEHTAWACSVEVTAIPKQAVSAVEDDAQTGPEARNEIPPGKWAAEFRCTSCGRLQPRHAGPGRPRRYCSTECRMAGHRLRQRRTAGSA